MRNIAVLTLLSAAAFAGPTDIERCRSGTHWLGPDVEPADLVGKVVLVEYWGQ